MNRVATCASLPSMPVAERLSIRGNSFGSRLGV